MGSGRIGRARATRPPHPTARRTTARRPRLRYHRPGVASPPARRHALLLTAKGQVSKLGPGDAGVAVLVQLVNDPADPGRAGEDVLALNPCSRLINLPL